MRRRTFAVATLALAAQALGPVAPTHAADPVTVTFQVTGDEEQFQVPAGVTTLQVVLIGGKGGAGGTFGGSGGFGHRVSGDLAVAPGTTLYVAVGRNGFPNGASGQGGPAAFNGGGAGGTATAGGGASGGGATDIRTVSRTQPGSLESRLIVAGGGGGGSAGTSGGSGSGGDAGAAGGGFQGGGAGTATSGGAAGSGATPGTLGTGGAGGGNLQESTAAGGGGGGGGYYGGGGGRVSFFGTTPGGGGGGSSFTGSATNPSVVVDTSGAPSISITYDPDGGGGGSNTGTVDAVVTMAASAVCLELSTTSIDFGTRQFGEVEAVASPGIRITNCGGITETVLGRGTDASGSGSTTWSLVPDGACAGGTLALDAYRLLLIDPGTVGKLPLATTNTSLFTLGGGAMASGLAAIDTPCPGSSGAGEVMSMQIVFTATE